MRKVTNALAELSQQQALKILWGQEKEVVVYNKRSRVRSWLLLYSFDTANCEVLQVIGGQVFSSKMYDQGDYSLQVQIPNVILLERKYGYLIKFSLIIYIPQKRHKTQFGNVVAVWGCFFSVWGDFFELDEDNIELALLQSIQVQSGRKRSAGWDQHIL